MQHWSLTRKINTRAGETTTKPISTNRNQWQTSQIFLIITGTTDQTISSVLVEGQPYNRREVASMDLYLELNPGKTICSIRQLLYSHRLNRYQMSQRNENATTSKSYELKVICFVLNCKKINLLWWLMSKSLKSCNVGSWKSALCSHRQTIWICLLDIWKLSTCCLCLPEKFTNLSYSEFFFDNRELYW